MQPEPGASGLLITQADASFGRVGRYNSMSILSGAEKGQWA